MIIPVANRLNSVQEYYFSRKLQEVRELSARGRDVINLGIGNPDLPPPPQAIQTLRHTAALPDSHGYQPYRGIPELRQAMADWYRHTYGVHLDAAEEVLPLMGSKEGIVHISLAFLNPGDQVLVPDPGYPAYASAARLAGGQPVFYNLREEHHWLPDRDELEALDTSRVRLMWVNYPHMPTGAVAGEDTFAELVAFARERRILLCHDNPYSRILNPQLPLSILQLPGAREGCLELNSLSKSFHMAGWRVGMVVGAAPYLETIIKVKSNLDSGMFLPVQQAAVEVLRMSSDWHEQQNIRYQRRRELIRQLLDTRGCTWSPDTAGLFVWGKLPDDIADAETFVDQLLYSAGIFLAPGTVFGNNGKRYIRASLCAPEERIQQAIERIHQTMRVKV